LELIGSAWVHFGRLSVKKYCNIECLMADESFRKWWQALRMQYGFGHRLWNPRAESNPQ